MKLQQPDQDPLIGYGERRRDRVVAAVVVFLAAVGVAAMFLCAVAYWRLFLAPGK